MSMYLSGGNAHDRRKAARAHLHAARKQRIKTEAATLAVWSPIGLAIGAPASAMRSYQADAVAKMIHATEMVLPKSQPAGFQFIEGGSVRNMRTKSVATMLVHYEDQMKPGVLVHRRDNRKVEWPVSECENWNL